MSRRPGRPTKTEQKKIKDEIFELYSNGFEVPFIIQTTKYDENTVRKYVNEFDDAMFTSKPVDEKYLNHARQRMLHSFDTIKYETEKSKFPIKLIYSMLHSFDTIKYETKTIGKARKRGRQLTITKQDIQQPEIDFSQAMRVDAKYQDIIYYKWDRHESVSSSQNKKISYHQAVSEMERLDWKFVHNHFGLVNKHTNETIQFVRPDKDRWYVENLIDSGTKWNGYLWYSQTDSKSLYEMVRLFLEEAPWSHVLKWNLKKVIIQCA